MHLDPRVDRTRILVGIAGQSFLFLFTIAASRRERPHLNLFIFTTTPAIDYFHYISRARLRLSIVAYTASSYTQCIALIY